MKYQVTQELLDVLRKFMPLVTESQDHSGGETDFVSIDDGNHVGFEVFEDEIIVFFFSTHRHFTDSYFALEEGAPDYIERAKAFLTDLLSCTVTRQKEFRGNVPIREKIIFTYPDGTTDEPAGVTVHISLAYLIPFLQKRTETRSWKFDKEKAYFVPL